MYTTVSTHVVIAAALMLVSSLGVSYAMQRGLEPGGVYREYTRIMTDNLAWRVTDPGPGHAGKKAFLPNPVHELTISDLAGAVRAEAVIDFWGGHPTTEGKKLRFNTNDWLALPELATTPPGELPSAYMQQYTLTVEVPLAHLVEGENTFEGTAGNQADGFGWGQWGWYGMIVRVYYDEEKPHPHGRITSPASGQGLAENPVIAAAVESTAGVDRVEFYGYYEGYDENGDGVYRGWHHAYTLDDVTGHVGTVGSAPWEVVWDTRWVPDQPQGAVKIVARVRDANGVWSVTDAVEGLGLARQGERVRLYKPQDVPPSFWVRAGATKSCRVEIPTEDDLPRAVEASLHVRTWNGASEAVTVNGEAIAIRGADHRFAYNALSVSPEILRQGENEIEFHSDTELHGVEILWPGPGLVVRYATAEHPRAAVSLPVEVDAAGYQRIDYPVDVVLDLAARLPAGGVGSSGLEPIRLVELDDQGEVLDPRVDFQFDREPVASNRGTLVFVLRGVTGPQQTRHYMLHLGAAGEASPTTTRLVKVTDGVMRAGEECYRIETLSAVYYYDKAGAGFASMEDRDGVDWVSYKPGGGPAGEYRGIPNLVYPEGSFHPGRGGSASKLLTAGPIKASVYSETLDGKWACRWDFYPTFARMTVLKADHPYWFLYEGTPGGDFVPGNTLWERSDGEAGPGTEAWATELSGLKWVSFHEDYGLHRSIYVAQRDPDSVINSYYEMAGEMTVFGFGRKDLNTYLTHVPAEFTVGFAEHRLRDDVEGVVMGNCREATVRVGEARLAE